MKPARAPRSGRARLLHRLRTAPPHRWGLLLLAAGALVLWWARATPVHALDELWHDAWIRFTAPGKAERTAIVAIDDASLDRLGRWPWPRARLAALVEAVRAAGARTVVLDLLLSEPGDREGDARLARALARVRAVEGVLLYFREENLFASRGETALDAIAQGLYARVDERPPVHVPRAVAMETNHAPLVRAAAAVGFLNFTPDGDGVLRYFPLFAAHGGFYVPPLALAAAAVHTHARPEARLGPWENVARIGAREIRTGSRGLVWPAYLGPNETVPRLAAWQVLEGRIPPGALAGRMVFIGFTASGLSDLRPTPTDRFMHGVEVHAQLAEALLDGAVLVRPAWVGLVEILLILAGTLWLALWNRHLARRDHGLSGLAAIAALYLLAAMFYAHGIRMLPSAAVLEVVAGIPLLLALRHAASLREQHRLHDTFARYIDPAIVGEALKHPGRLGIEGEEREISVMFVDVAGFTRLSEQMPPREVERCIRAFFDAATPIVFAHEGAIDRLTGDGMIVLFGAPIRDPEHAVHACGAAIALDGAVARAKPSFREAGGELHIRVGINSGPMIVGNMGSSQRMHYTFIGDAGNVASRLESLNKQYGSRRMIGPRTRELVGDAFVCRELDTVVLQGRDRPITVWELLDPGEKRARWQPLLDAYARALSLYRMGMFGEAARAFAETAERFGDPVSRTMAARCRRLADDPPANWEGIWVAQQK